MNASRALPESVRRAWRRLRGGELSAKRAAASVAVGLLVGLTPLYGFHLPLVLLICLPLKLDAPIAYLAAHISLPFVSPFIVFGEIELGALLRQGSFVELDVEVIRARGFGPFVVDLIVGTCVVAPAGAALGYGITYALGRAAEKRREARGEARPAATVDPLFAAADAVARRYASGRKATYYYVRGKLASDPVARALVDRAGASPLGEVVDVGCGRGQMALLLLEAKGATHVRGFDWDGVKIGDAKRAASDGGVELAADFEEGDVRTTEIPACDTVLLIDVLHYLDVAAQDDLLERAAKAARGSVLIRDLDPDRGLRSVMTRVEEWIATRTRVNRAGTSGTHLRPIADITSRLESYGMTTRVEPCWAGTPFANVLMIAERAQDASDAESASSSRTSASKTDAK